MKIESKQLHNFVKKASLNGAILTTHLDFREDGVHTRVADSSSITLTDTFLKKEAFIEYEAIGNIFIKDSKYLLEMLNSFTDTIDIVKENEYTIKISFEKRKAYILLADESICGNIYTKDVPSMETPVTFSVSKTELTPIIKDLKNLKATAVRIIGKDNNIIFEVGEKNESDYTQSVIGDELEFEDFKTKIGPDFMNFYDVLTDRCSISTGNEIPVFIKEKSDFIEFTMIIAPMIE